MQHARQHLMHSYFCGEVTKEGQVVGPDGKRVGTLQDDGMVVKADGAVLGLSVLLAKARTVSTQEVAGPDGKRVGTLQDDGMVVQADSTVLGLSVLFAAWAS